MIKNFQKKYSRAMLFIVFILTACILFCFIHIYKMQESIKTSVLESLKNDVQMRNDIMEERFEGYKTIAKQASARLDAINYLNEKSIHSALQSYTKSGAFDNVYFVDLKGCYYPEIGHKVEAIDKEEYTLLQELTKENEPAVVGNINRTEVKDGMVVFSPVGDGVLKGYFVGYQKCDDYFIPENRNQGDLNKTILLINKDGTVILQNTDEINSNACFSGVRNIYMTLESMEMEETELKALKEEISIQESGIKKITTRSKNLYVVYSTVDNSNNFKTVCFVDKAEIDLAVISETQKRNIFIVGIVICVLLVILSIIYSSKALYKRIESVFYSDELTQSKNMNYFHDKAVELIQEEHKFSYLLARFDITNFRYINEAFGYERGNEILQTIANYAEDNFGSKEVFARNTADQFTALMVDLDDIEKRMNDFAKRINEYAKSIDVNYPIILRTGYYHIKDSNENIDDIIDKANLARKSITKKSNRQTVEYTVGMQKDLKRREEIEASMEEALQQGEFKVYIQPKFDIMTNCIAGGEALVRWIRQDGTMVYPDEFISVFEQNGFIEKLDFYMLEEICKHMGNLLSNGMEIMPISVNQSRVLLMNPEYVKKVKKILKKYNIPKEMIELELTETVFLDEREKMISVMKELKSQDIILDIDDFGSGYSSLNLLKDVPFDILKIDREFFSETSTSETSMWILRKIVEMADGLGVSCICEGVETKEQESVLKEIGCRYAQGYLYSKPMPSKEFIDKYVSK